MEKDGLGGDGRAVIGRAINGSGSNKLLPAARRKGHREVVGKEDWTDRGGCVPEMRGGRADSGHIVFRCGKVRRVKDERGRKDWARETG